MSNIYRKATIYNLNKVMICDAEVLGKRDNVITIMLKENISSKMHSDLYVTLYDDVYGLLTYKSKIIEYKKIVSASFSIQYKVRCELIDLVEILQRRNNVKVKTNISTTITLVDDEDEEIINLKTQRPFDYAAFIKDISASGVFVTTEEELAISQRFVFIFSESPKPIRIISEIIRIQKLSKGGYGYGCKFLNMSDSMESVVRRFVFKVQLSESRNDVTSDWITPDVKTASIKK